MVNLPDGLSSFLHSIRGPSSSDTPRTRNAPNLSLQTYVVDSTTEPAAARRKTGGMHSLPHAIWRAQCEYACCRTHASQKPPAQGQNEPKTTDSPGYEQIQFRRLPRNCDCLALGITYVTKNAVTPANVNSFAFLAEVAHRVECIPPCGVELFVAIQQQSEVNQTPCRVTKPFKIF
jgi:hypothetical protein